MPWEINLLCNATNNCGVWFSSRTLANRNGSVLFGGKFEYLMWNILKSWIKIESNGVIDWFGFSFLFFLKSRNQKIRKNSTKGYCACWPRYLISTLSGWILPEAVWLVKSCIKFDFVPRVTSVESTRNPLKRNCSTTPEHQEIKFITVSRNLPLNPRVVE